MFEEMMVRYCSPTLAGMKTGSIFTYPFSDAAKMREHFCRWNRALGGKGLRLIPLRFRNHRALVYVYRPEQLRRDLQQEAARKLLGQRGYGLKTPECCILHLMRRLAECREFPHEIGLFLGYPPEDVDGFIENRGEGCKCAGCWKIYGDAEAAQKLFEKYKKCTDIYCACLAGGMSVERLTVKNGLPYKN